MSLSQHVVYRMRYTHMMYVKQPNMACLLYTLFCFLTLIIYFLWGYFNMCLMRLGCFQHTLPLFIWKGIIHICWRNKEYCLVTYVLMCQVSCFLKVYLYVLHFIGCVTFTGKVYGTTQLWLSILFTYTQLKRKDCHN